MAPPVTLVEPLRGVIAEQAACALHDLPGFAWLDSALVHPRYGRWSILSAAPRWTLVARGRALRIDSPRGAREVEGDPLTVFADLVEREQLRRAPSDNPPAALPFTGGAIGYLGFELARQIERLPATTLDDVGAPDLAVGWYDAALVFDHIEDRAWLVGDPKAAETLRTALACLPAAAVDQSRSAPYVEGCLPPLRSNMSRQEYLTRVAAARRYIEAGDIYQVNLSQRFTAPLREAPFDAYRRLRRLSPAPFAAYLDSPGGVTALSSSPERLLLVDGERLETRPIKGTRPRGRDAREDACLAAELRASTKDDAEHVMIVDLERNDLGRIAEIGSVCVEEYAALERYAHVHHLTSTIAARRRADVGLAATLRAILPGGSISGAPKIRALEIIDELEPTVRGIYTGAIGYVSASGRVDLNVAIRTLTVAGQKAYAHVGGAIVYDSVPEDEYAETLQKARGMARALGARLPDEG